MSYIGSSPLPIPTFQDSRDACPKDLLAFIESIITTLKNDTAEEILRTERSKWMSMFNTLNWAVLVTPCQPDEYPWNTMHERVKLLEVSFKVLCSASEQCGDILSHNAELAKSMIVKLLDISTSLDVWLDVTGVPLKAGFPGPGTLRATCTQATIGMLKAFGNGLRIDNAGKPGWHILRDIAEEFFALCRELMSVPQAGPFHIHFFAHPRIRPGRPPPPPPRKKAKEEDKKPKQEAKSRSRTKEEIEKEAQEEAVDKDVLKWAFVYVADPIQTPLLLSMLLELILGAFAAPLVGQCFFKSLVSRTAELAREVHDFLVSPACITSDVKRARAISRLIVAISTGLQNHPPFNVVADPLRLHVLIRRLSDGPTEAWATADKVLLSAFSTPFASPISRADVRSILLLLREEQWQDAGEDLRFLSCAFIQAALPNLDAETLQEIRQFATSKADDASFEKLLQAIDKQKAGPVGGPASQPANQEAQASLGFRQDVKDIVLSIIQPLGLDWMDDEETMDDDAFIERALNDVERRFDRPIYKPSAEGRLALAQDLARLPCALARHAGARCPGTRPAAAIDCLKAAMVVLACVLDGEPRETTPPVRRAVYVALARAVGHQTRPCDDGALQHVIHFAARGMRDRDRPVRLAAGRCIAELVQYHQRMNPRDPKHLEEIFHVLDHILASGEGYSKETTLVTVGHIAKTDVPEILARSIFCFLSQIDNVNQLLRGVAYLQLDATAKYHKKSAYVLLSSHMPRIAPYLIRRIKTHPTALIEVCSFISTRAPAFIAVTLPHTLPDLFARCERDTLDTLSREIGVSIQILFLDHAPRILAHVFMLASPGRTSKALNFIVATLASVSPDSAAIDIQFIVRSYLMDLIGNIVMRMGDEDPDAVQIAKEALVKVQRNADKNRNQYDSTDEAVKAILQQHMLGIVSQLNDSLQEAHGKQTVESKRQIIRSLGAFIHEVGSAIHTVAPQIMATMQTTLAIKELAETTLKTWDIFLRALKMEDLGTHVGPTSAAFVISWPIFTDAAKATATRCLEHVILRKKNGQADYMDDIVDMSSIPELLPLWQKVQALRTRWTSDRTLKNLLARITSDNTAVISQALEEMKAFMVQDDEEFVRGLASGDMFDPLVGEVMTALFTVAARDLDDSEHVRLLALECIGICGAVDPDRFEFGGGESKMIVKYNFRDESESVAFAVHLIKDVLVGAFRSTCDIAYQNFLAYAIQELLRFCRFTPSLVMPGSSGSLPMKVRSRWKELPRPVKETVAPLLAGRFAFAPKPSVPAEHPIYPNHSSYREWIQSWTACLLEQTSGEDARRIFLAFHPVVRNKDVGVARHLLPHLVLNILLSGDEDHVQDIRTEILTVLEDQVNPDSTSNADKKELSAQAVFSLMDHLNRWVRLVREDVSARRKKANAGTSAEEEQLLRVDSVLTSIDQSLMAKAALQCKAYARALMCFEQQLVALNDAKSQSDSRIAAYETLHEIYAQLDEPDGMEGITTMILSPSLEHQIREHESTGRWTSAQSCWEVRLQHSPNDLKSHLGLLRCLRNLGHYDTMRTHVDGLLIRNPAWVSELIDYQVESGCMIGNWNEVGELVRRTERESSPVLLARVLLAMRSGDADAVTSSLLTARRALGAPISAAGSQSYRRSYDAVLNLHMLHELQVIFSQAKVASQEQDLDARLNELQIRLASRLDCTLANFRSREPILSIRRTALSLQLPERHQFKEVIGRSWLLSARLARKAGYQQTAYSAVLQAQQNNAPFWFIQSAKLTRARGDPLRALQDIENSLAQLERELPTAGIREDETKMVKAKVTTLRARWLSELDRYDQQYVLNLFQTAAKLLDKWESGWFHSGRWHDECSKNIPIPPMPVADDKKDSQDKGKSQDLKNETDKEKAERQRKEMERAKEIKELKRSRLLMVLHVVHNFSNACIFGSKYIYQALPRVLTLWLNLADEGPTITSTDEFRKINQEVSRAMKHVPIYKWYTAFPQIISRVGHQNADIWSMLQKLIRTVIQEYPNQALWKFVAVVKSNQTSRSRRGQAILQKLKGHALNDVPQLVEASIGLTEALLKLCDYPVNGDKQKSLSMSRSFPRLLKLLPSPIIIPLQESLSASMPPASSAKSQHQPFPVDAPTFHEFMDEIEIMRSMARPRKLTIIGSDGQTYVFLGKPKDDLRKDARLMDFNAIINKQLKASSESRRRQLYIRTYGVVTLNEECGFIQWVPNTIPLRTPLLKMYEARGIKLWGDVLHAIFERITRQREPEAAQTFKREVLTLFPPLLHEWFVETFPEPTAWLSSRLAYTRTTAVMSMVGFILGLGDRHCENMLLDTRTGDFVHVDFNCLFEKGKRLQTPERVPFRLTQNIVDGFGVTGVEGVFRIACEITMALLRANRECLMTVLDAFVHDPLVEWQDERKSLQKNQVQESADLLQLARGALHPIAKKLQGIYAVGKDQVSEKEIPVSSMVQLLIAESTDLKNLCKMYPGWSPYL